MNTPTNPKLLRAYVWEITYEPFGIVVSVVAEDVEQARAIGRQVARQGYHIRSIISREGHVYMVNPESR